MSNVLDRIRKRVGKVVHRVDAPVVASSMVVRVANPVQQWVSHFHVGMFYVYLGSQNVSTVLEFACPHACKKVEVFFGRTISINTCRSGLGKSSAHFANLLFRGAVDVGFPVLN